MAINVAATALDVPVTFGTAGLWFDSGDALIPVTVTLGRAFYVHSPPAARNTALDSYYNAQARDSAGVAGRGVIKLVVSFCPNGAWDAFDAAYDPVIVVTVTLTSNAGFKGAMLNDGDDTVIDVTVTDLFQADTVARRIGQLTGLKAESWIETNAQLMNALSSQRLSTTMISFFVAVSVAFGIASVLAISVTQRTREIGILRAMGMRRSQMLQVFLIQGAVLGMAGSAFGAAAGYALVWSFNTFGPRLFYIPLMPSLIPLTMLSATITGVLAAMVPAWRAARLNPVEAIRYV